MAKLTVTFKDEVYEDLNKMAKDRNRSKVSEIVDIVEKEIKKYKERKK